MIFYKCDKKQSGGSGIRIGDVSHFSSSSETAVRKITLTWTDPDDIVIGGIKQVEWGGTLIVRKAGDVPTSTGDGVVVVNSTTRNQYSVNGFEDTDISFNVTYYYRAFPYSTDDLTTEGSYISEEVEGISIFGARWDGTASSSWSRTDDAANFTDPIPAVNNGSGSSPFDGIMPWAGMQRVEDADAGTLVSIPKYYYKWTRENTAMQLQISSREFAGSHVSPAHADRGDGYGERDVVYVGAYHCAQDYEDTSNRFKSLTNKWCMGNLVISEFRTGIHGLGSKIWQYDFAMYWTIMMLYLVEFADWNSQLKIGSGCSASGDAELTGACDNMIYHTGTSAINRETYGHTRYRYIEDLWGNSYDVVDGIYFLDNDIYCIKNPGQFSDSTGGTKVGTRATYGGILCFVSKWTNPSVPGFEYALYPSVTLRMYGEYDVTTIYSCDSYYANGGTNLQVGASNRQNQYSGAFLFVGELTSSYKSPDIGCRLMKLP